MENIQTMGKPHIYTLKLYKETPVFIPVGIAEDVVKSVARKLLGSAGAGGTDLDALQGWLIKFKDHSKKLHVSVETFVEWLADRSPSCAAYWEFMSVLLISLYKIPGVRPVDVG